MNIKAMPRIYDAMQEMENPRCIASRARLPCSLPTPPVVLALSLRCIFSQSTSFRCWHTAYALAVRMYGYVHVILFIRIAEKKSHTEMLLRYVSSCYSVSTQTKSRMFHCTSERSYCRSNERLFALTLRSVQWLRNKSDDKISVGRNVKFFVSVKMDSVDSKCNWQLIRMIFIKLRLVCSLFLYKMKFLHVYIVSASLLFDFAEFYSQCCTSAFAYLYSH